MVKSPASAIRRRDAVGLGQRHRAAFDAELVEDGEVLARLRHHAVVGRHHQQREVDACRAGEHGVDEALVAGHVDEAEHAAAFERLVGVAEFDRDAARLLLLEAIGVDAGEGMHQRGLAVVDVAGGADDHAGAVISFEVIR
jgi:hypothetical protein